MARRIISFVIACVLLQHVGIVSCRKEHRDLTLEQEPTSDVVALDDKKVSLRCKASPGAAEISWLFNGAPLQEEEFKPLIKKFAKTPRTSKLIFQFPSSGHDEESLEVKAALARLRSGVFQCVAKLDRQVIVSQPAKLIVAWIEDFEAATNITVTVVEGNIAVIPCTPPNGAPNIVTEFLANGTLINRSKGE